LTFSGATRVLLLSGITLENLRPSANSSMSELALANFRSFFGAGTTRGFLNGLLS